MEPKRRPRPGQEGFSLIELLVVVGIIAVMSSVALPNFIAFLRNYQISGAAEQVAGEVQTARAKAIMKNVNWGVVFLVLNQTQYRYLYEDDITGGTAARVTVPNALTQPPQLGPIKTLPTGVQFGAAAACPAFAPNDSGARFDRLGSWCDPVAASTTCPDLGAGQNLAMNCPGAGCPANQSGTRLCLVQQLTGLRRQVDVSPGGRVLVLR